MGVDVKMGGNLSKRIYIHGGDATSRTEKNRKRK